MLVAQNCSQLAHLNLNWCWGVHDASVEAVLRANPGLETFEAAGVKKITSGALICLAEQPQLACPSLTMLDVRQCDFIDDAALVAIRRALRLQQKGALATVIGFYGNTV
jgi:hypothetical protein